MLDSIMDGLKGQAVDMLKEKTGLDAGQAEQAVPLAKESITEGLTSAISGGNVGGIVDMFKSATGGGGEGGLVQNMVYKGIAGSFISKLTSSLGIGEGMAGTVSSMALPFIMSKLGGKAADDSGEVSQSGIMSMVGLDAGSLTDGLKDKAADALKGKLPGGIGGMFG